MTTPMRDLDLYTDAELALALARAVAHARGETLNDAALQKISQICKEIRRRARPVKAP